uniref:HSF-type DNA-binding domain-containing protein n=1 Tax=Globisporangium ultimum (strain ATCC 200006 / CBS 805.95 / DAOM BR144) TaxID=431595 RepID=K3WJA4_GLOUD
MSHASNTTKLNNSSNMQQSCGPVDTSQGLAAAFASGTTIVSGGNGSSATVVCKVPKFLRSLYAILQTEDPAVISWVQNQELKPNRVTAFHILDMDRFEREILPKYFKHQKFASFQRQLNNFGFRKWTKTQSSGVCTFSHNCFPPDPNHTGVMRASIREQWRQKSTLTTSTSSSSLSSVASSPQPTRRRVGNGITKADRKNQNNNTRRPPVNVQIPHTESFMDLYKSPLNSALAMESHRQHQQYLSAPSHQPAMKKLARPLQELSGLEAFCDESYKQFILPPLQPHHLLSSTPRGLYSSSSSHEPEPTTPNLGGFPHGRNVEFNVKPYDYPNNDKMSHHHHHGGSIDAGFNGTFIEPWTWDPNMNSALELTNFPLDFWQDAASSNGNQNNNNGHHTVAVSVGVASSAAPSSKDANAYCHAQDRAMPSAEEFGLETFLFAE